MKAPGIHEEYTGPYLAIARATCSRAWVRCAGSSWTGSRSWRRASSRN